MTSLHEKQELLRHYVRLVARKHSASLFVTGQGGIGKSKTILDELEREGIEPVVVNSHITPLSLYSIFHRHKVDDVIFFDDIEGIFSTACSGLLRSALYGFPRIVTYNSSQLPPDLPPKFEFTSRCIFSVNDLPSQKKESFLAVLSRCDVYELSASNSEVIEMMREIASNGFRNVTPEECKTVIDFIEENVEEDKQISLRLLSPSIRKLLYAKYEGIDWRPLVKSQLKTLGRKSVETKSLDTKASDRLALIDAINEFPKSVQQQQEHWQDKTQKSRASFFRALSAYRKEKESNM